MTAAPVALMLADLPRERFDDAARGTLSWSTLFSADRTPTEALVCGVSILAPGEMLALHSHAEPEVYFGLAGNVRVTVAGADYDLVPGMALFIPGGAVHGVVAQGGPAQFFYVFAKDSFADIAYDFSASAPGATTP